MATTAKIFPGTRWLEILLSLVLGGITLAVYWPARHFDMVYYDDPLFIRLPDLAKGLNWDGIKWAMTAIVAKNWHPVTTFSFLLMHQSFGVNPGAEHLVNVIFHAANAVLLLLVLLSLTAKNTKGFSTTDEKSRVQSPESKVQSLASAQSPRSKAPSPQSSIPCPPKPWRRRIHPPSSDLWLCAIVAAIFAWHPLRVESVAWISERKDVLFAFFMLLSLFCYASYARSRSKDRTPGANFSALISPFLDLRYGLMLFFFILSFMCKGTVVTLPLLLLLLDLWPLRRFNRSTARGLFVEKIPLFVLAFCFSVFTLWIHKAHGDTHGDIMSLGHFGLAGRIENAILSYVNYLGKFFYPANLAVLYPYPKNFGGAGVLPAALLLLAISALCVLQIPRRPYLAAGWFWYLVAMLPVIGFVQIGAQAMADRHTYIALIGPLAGLVWLVAEWAQSKRLRRFLGAMAAVIIAGCIILTQRQLQFWQNSVSLFEHTIAVTPENSLAQCPLAMGLEEEGHLRQAAVRYRVALATHPDYTHYLANYYLADLLWRFGRYHEAETNMQAAAQANPDLIEALNGLAWMLATSPDAGARDGARAVRVAESACEKTHYQVTMFMGTLAAAYAEAGRFDDATATARKAIELAQQHGETDLTERNKQLLQMYLAHKAYHEAPSAGPSG